MEKGETDMDKLPAQGDSTEIRICTEMRVQLQELPHSLALGTTTRGS